MTIDIPIDTVSPDQVLAAREYIRRIGDERFVSERIVAVAHLPLEEVHRAWAKRPPNDPEKIQVAQILIRLAGGEKNVDPRIVAIAHMTPAVSEAGAAR